MMINVRTAVVVLLLGSGCGQTEECTKLAAMVKQHELVLADAKARANVRPAAQKRADATEKAMHKLLDESGIEQPDEQLAAELARRVATVPTATMSQALTQLGTTEEGEAITTTEWTLRFTEKDLSKAWDKVVVLASVPPLLGLSTLAREKGGDRWMLQLHRALPVRTPVQPAKVPLPKLEDPSAVASQVGFCGAGDLRKKLAAIAAEVEQNRAAAEEATLLIATAPTFEGIRRRAELAVRTERDARAIMTQVMEGVLKQKLALKAIGYAEPAVVVEVFGGPPELKTLETLLLPLGDRVKPSELNQPGVVRRLIVVSQPKRGTGEGPGGLPNIEQMQGHGDHDGHGH